jgi:hypothetical protein
MSDDARQLAQWGDEILVVSGQNVQMIASHRRAIDGESRQERGQSQGEPSIQEVQEMAIRYCDVSNEKIRAWQRGARLKALLPKFSYDRDKTVTTALGASYDKTQVGPQDWGISFSWDFSDLVYSESQTSIDSRAKLMVDQRNDILSEVTRLYFERKKIQMEIASEKKMSEGELNGKRLRLMELTALIDRLTGGTYSKLLKSQ